MRDNVEIYTTSLIHAIHDSREYREFEAIKRQLRDNPELKRKINEYRRDTYRLQNYGNVDTLYHEMEEFRNKNAEFRKDPLVTEYLRCELAVCRMLQKIATTVVESVDLELDDVAGEIRC